MDQGCSLLLVDDNVIDIESVTRALRRVGGGHSLNSVGSGVDALTHLEQRLGQDGALPDLVLLDLSLPETNGLQVLSTLKTNEKFSHIPVVIFSSSRSGHDIKSAYREGANGFVTKPPDFDSLVQALDGILKYWRDVAELPP